MDLLKPLIALLAIVNPIGVVPFFIHFTQAFTPQERQRTIRISAFAAFVVIAVSALAGLKIIEFFGISLASFQVGGGCLLLINSLAMLNAQPAESKPNDVSEGQEKLDAGASIAKVLGRTGINVMTRLMGLMLAAMAVELLADGLVKLFPVLASHVG